MEKKFGIQGYLNVQVNPALRIIFILLSHSDHLSMIKLLYDNFADRPADKNDLRLF
jgi:hypothetical protein